MAEALKPSPRARKEERRRREEEELEGQREEDRVMA